MFRILVLVCFQVIVLQACDATVADGREVVADTIVEKIQHDAEHSRLVSVYLKPQQDFGFTPLYDRRVVVAEPVTTVPSTMARGYVLVNGIDVVHLGRSCKLLQQKYPELSACEEEETAELQYGEIEATTTTDSQGFSTISVSSAKKYRLRVKSWATEEDAKCFWGGEQMLNSTDNTVTVPVLIFCE